MVNGEKARILSQEKPSLQGYLLVLWTSAIFITDYVHTYKMIYECTFKIKFYIYTKLN